MNRGKSAILIIAACLPLLLFVTTRAAEEPQELSELELLPDHIIRKIGRKLSEKDLARLILTSKMFKNVLQKSLEDRGEQIKYWSRQDIISKVIGSHQWVTSLVFLLDGTLASGAYTDPMIRLWDIKDGEQIKRLTGHTQGIRSIALSSDGQILVSGSWDGTIIVWDVKSGEPIQKIACNAGQIRTVAISSDRQTIAYGASNGTVYLRNLHTGDEPIAMKYIAPDIAAVAFSPNGKFLTAAPLTNSIVCLWDLVTGAVKKLNGHTKKLSSVLFSPNGRLLASASYDDTVRLWDVEKCEQISELKGAASFTPIALAFSKDSKVLAAASLFVSECHDNSVRLWKVATGKLIQEFRADIPPVYWGYNALANAVAFSPDGKSLALGCYNGNIRIWHAVDQK